MRIGVRAGEDEGMIFILYPHPPVEMGRVTLSYATLQGDGSTG